MKRTRKFATLAEAQGAFSVGTAYRWVEIDGFTIDLLNLGQHVDREEYQPPVEEADLPPLAVPDVAAVATCPWCRAPMTDGAP